MMEDLGRASRPVEEIETNTGTSRCNTLCCAAGFFVPCQLNEEGVPMWQSVKRADIERAKTGIELRRAETLKRQAEELGRLERDESELATLNRLIDDFAGKYGKFMRLPAPAKAAAEPVAAKKNAAEPVAPKVATEPVATTITVEPVAAKVAVHRRAPEPRRLERRDFPRTNFEAFARAVARTGP